MADLPESNEWTTGIYQLETSDPVLGGPEGIDNLQAKQLANRTRWLKDRIDTLGVSLAGKAGKATTLGGYGITDAFTKPEATSAIQQAIASLVASSPAALDTLKELADALGNDPNFATTMTNALAGKANKATTLGGYGITDAYPKTGTYSKAEVDELLKYATSLPIGGMLPFPKGAVPAGFLEVDGSVQSAAVYPELAAYLGTTFNTGGEGAGNFRLPDSRGEFLRGWDHGRGVDTGRGLGSKQLDAMEIITGNVGGVRNDTASVTPSGPFSTVSEAGDFATGPGRLTSVVFDSSKVVRTATETRPRNLAVMWCIKAWNAPINQGSIDIAALAPLAAQATEINQGTAKIATDVQMRDSGNDAVIATPKKLRLGFSISLAANGYIVFPAWMGGLVVQWGSGTSSGAVVENVSIPMPLAWPTGSFAEHATIVGSDTGTHSVLRGTMTTNMMKLTTLRNGAYASGITLRWIAVGY